MIKEQLKKEAEKNIFNLKNNAIKVSGKPFQITEGDYIQGYLDGAEPREKRIKHLEESLLDVTKKSVKRIEELETRCTELFLQNNEYAEQLTKVNLLLEDVYKIAMGDWNDPKWHDQVLQKAREYLKGIEK